VELLLILGGRFHCLDDFLPLALGHPEQAEEKITAARHGPFFFVGTVDFCWVADEDGGVQKCGRSVRSLPEK
jgi:hypothetical protein